MLKIFSKFLKLLFIYLFITQHHKAKYFNLVTSRSQGLLASVTFLCLVLLFKVVKSLDHCFQIELSNEKGLSWHFLLRSIWQHYFTMFQTAITIAKEKENNELLGKWKLETKQKIKKRPKKKTTKKKFIQFVLAIRTSKFNIFIILISL